MVPQSFAQKMRHRFARATQNEAIGVNRCESSRLRSWENPESLCRSQNARDNHSHGIRVRRETDKILTGILTK